MNGCVEVKIRLSIVWASKNVVLKIAFEFCNRVYGNEYQGENLRIAGNYFLRPIMVLKVSAHFP